MKLNLPKILGSITLLFLALLPPNTLSAQFTLTPSTLNETAAKIDYLFGDKMSITSNELKAFLGDQIAGAYDSNLKAPEAEIDAVTDSKVSFNWSTVSGASSYQSRYFSLKDGTTAGNESPNTSQDFTIPNDLYLYTFQAKSAQFIGPVYIIIEDKPLALVTNPSDCFCRRANTVYSGDVTANMYDLYTYPTTGEHILLFNVIFSHQRDDSPFHTSEFAVEITVSEGELQSVIIPKQADTNKPCLLNADYSESSIFALETGELLSSPEEFFASRFDFQDGAFQFLVFPNHVGYIYVNKCDSRHHREINPETFATAPKLYPNPSTGLFTLERMPDAILDQEIVVKNSIGQYIAMTPFSADQSTTQIDLTDQPNGIYFLELRTSTGVEVIQMVKTE